jgi:hypothetical protein
MKQKKDTRFWLTTFSEEQEQTKHEYKSFKREIENNGCFKVKTETDTVKIYTPELAVIFTSKELPSRNMDTQTETNINGWEYLKTYIEAYKEGEQYFETEFKVSPNTLYGANAEQYVRDIHLNFFHVKHTGINEGWGYVKKQYPIILTHKAVKEFGYYSGIVNKVEEQVKKYPRLFATFDKCEHNLPPQQTEKPKPELKLKDFFIKEVSSDTIEAIQTEFRELEGKDLAILIYLLHKEHKIIELLTNSKTKGRKSFVKCLTETDNPSMQGVNKCFAANTDDLIYSKDDLVFQSLNKRLTETIKK